MTEYLTLEDIARRLRTSKRTVQRAKAAGQLRPEFYIGKSPRFTERELAAYVAYLAATSRAA